VIVSREYSEEGCTWFEKRSPAKHDHPACQSDYRIVSPKVWRAYQRCLKEQRKLVAEMEASPQLPAWLDWIAKRNREAEARTKAARKAAEQEGRDRLMQEQLRVAGVLRPLPLGDGGPD
jgi:hypothetical protein